MTWKEIGTIVLSLRARAMSGPSFLGNAVKVATLSVVGALAQMWKLGIVEDIRALKEDLKLRSQAKAKAEDAKAEKLMAEAVTEVNKANVILRNDRISVAEEAEKLANAAKTNAEAKAKLVAADAALIKAKADAFAKIIREIKTIKSKDGRVAINPETLNRLLDAAGITEPERVVEKAIEKTSERPAGKPNPIRIDYDGFLAKLTPKYRLNIERHIAAVEEVSTKDHAKLWKRLAVAMMSMAPHSAKANGQQSMQFYIQDGKYRMQIFALEDLRDGSIHVYAADAVDEATKAGLFSKAKAGDGTVELRLAETNETLNVERLDGKVSNPAPLYKDMLGWNRRAVHVTLPTTASEVQADAACKLLAFGAKKAGAIA